VVDWSRRGAPLLIPQFKNIDPLLRPSVHSRDTRMDREILEWIVNSHPAQKFTSAVEVVGVEY